MARKAKKILEVLSSGFAAGAGIAADASGGQKKKKLMTKPAPEGGMSQQKDPLSRPLQSKKRKKDLFGQIIDEAGRRSGRS